MSRRPSLRIRPAVLAFAREIERILQRQGYGQRFSPGYQHETTRNLFKVASRDLANLLMADRRDGSTEIASAAAQLGTTAMILFDKHREN